MNHETRNRRDHANDNGGRIGRRQEWSAVHAFWAGAEQKTGDADEQRGKREIDERRDEQQELAHGASENGGQALARTSMPASFSADCNSPAWNISRTMSQPPMNSPLT
jgi:hypothetical protein